MPYIVTTKRPQHDPLYEHGEWMNESLRAVATLEEVNDFIARLVHVATGAFGPACHSEALPESGGTVGPLPDRTLITIVPEPWRVMVLDVGHQWGRLARDNTDEPENQIKAEVIGAFNDQAKS